MHNFSLGWKPRRSLMFISWDAEEYGLVGSMEWLQVKLRYFDIPLNFIVSYNIFFTSMF